MKLDICQRGESTEVDVPEGRVSVGGDAADTLKIEGLPPHLLDLNVDGGRVTVCTRETLPIQGVLAPRNVPRLLLPGECVTLADEIELRVMAPPQPKQEAGTLAVLKQLLAGNTDPDCPGAASVTCLTGMDIGRRFYLVGSRTLIGRGSDARIRLRDRAASRHHARVRKGKEGYYVEDLGAPNGVYVNGTRLRTLRILNEGDIVEIGRSLLRFSGPTPNSPPASPEPTPAPAPPTRRRWSWPRKLVHGDWALIGMGAALALAGLIVGWGFAA